MKEQSLNIWNFNVYVTTGLEGGGALTLTSLIGWGGGGGGQLPLSQALYTLTTVALENQFKKMRLTPVQFIQSRSASTQVKKPLEFILVPKCPLFRDSTVVSHYHIIMIESIATDF